MYTGRPLCAGSRACVCYGGVERRDDPQASISHLAEEKSSKNSRIPLPLDTASPSPSPLLLLLVFSTRGRYRRTLWYIRGTTHMHKFPLPSFIHASLLFPPPSSSPPSPASPSTDRPARHHHSYNSARCKLHNLVTVSPGIVLSRTIPLS